MKRITILFVLLSMALLAQVSAEPATPESEKSIITEKETHSVFRGVIYKVWLKLRSYSPSVEAQQAGRGLVVVTAGIRGAESTESTLKPYWKDDRTNDKDFIEQVKALNHAQAMVDEGKIPEAKTALEKFIKQYSKGELLPNALFAQGLTLGAEGDTAGSIKILRKFADSYPQHPLRADADLVIAELQR